MRKTDAEVSITLLLVKVRFRTLPRPSQPGVLSKPLSNPCGYTLTACTVRVTDLEIDGHIALEPLQGAEVECNSYQKRAQKAEAAQKERERVEAESRAPGNPAQVSIEER